MNAILLIPIFEPQERTERFFEQLRKEVTNPIVIVDDGSGEKYRKTFERLVSRDLRVTLLRYSENKGKGYALKYGIRFIQENYPQASGIVTADGDGQHAIRDIKRMLQRVPKMAENVLLLGTRDFLKSETPFKSYWGNRLTTSFYYLASGYWLGDTQTGLRGFSCRFADELVKIPGERFEYEMNMLLDAAQLDLKIEELPIETIYEENNEHSHFRALQDSFLIYLQLFRFLFSSLASSIVDISVFLLLTAFFGEAAGTLLLATVIARIISGIFNYSMNKRFVFGDREMIRRSVFKYGLLFVFQMIASWLGVTLLSSLISSLIIAKALTDVFLFFFSYRLQRRFVFNT